MFNIILLIAIPLFVYFVNNFFLKKKLIPNFSGSDHQKFFDNTKVPLSGGLFLCLLSIIIFFEVSNIFIISFFLIFLLGFLSDTNFLSSVKWRFFFQSIIIFFLIYNTQSNIQSIRINFIDFYLQNFLISCLFTSFCMMILVNGFNFIDGLNGLVISYFLIILFFLFRLNSTELFFYGNINLIFFIILLITLLILNFLNNLYLGDSGSYLIGILTGYFMILTYIKSPHISPYFIALLLWYPVFEILFSIIRKLKLKKSPFKPDNNHLHHLLFYYLEKRFYLKKNKANNISSLIIIFYNFVIFNFAFLNISYTYYHIVLMVMNILIYLLIYKKFWDFKSIKS